jgi:hypothetical protein
MRRMDASFKNARALRCVQELGIFLKEQGSETIEMGSFENKAGNRCQSFLPAIRELQGDFREMQGAAKRKLAKRRRISIAWEALSLLQGAGRSREANLA